MIKPPICFNRKCVWYLGIIQPDGTELSETYACVAYPSGIPDEIILGDDLHLEVRDDQDNNIVYEEIEE